MRLTVAALLVALAAALALAAQDGPHPAGGGLQDDDRDEQRLLLLRVVLALEDLDRVLVTRELHDEKFFVRVADEKTGKIVRAATPLFLALVVINLADLVFAVDSVPAIA